MPQSPDDHETNEGSPSNIHQSHFEDITDTKTEFEVSLELETTGRVNFASAQNNVPVVKSLLIKNSGLSALIDLTVRLETSPAVIRSKTWRIDRLAVGDSLDLNDLTTPLDNSLLSGLNETETGTLTFTVTHEDTDLLVETRDLDLLARDQWGGLNDMDRLLAAFISPNDPVVASILKEASILLERSGQDGSMEGYQSNNPQRAWMIAGAIWSAMTGLGLTYANPPASFELAGQKVRSPARIRSEGLATCLDSSLLLAAAYEQAGLNPVVLFSDGHAWTGVWITKRDFGHVTEPDVVTVRKASQAKEFIPIETTLLSQRPTVGFEQAVEAGRSRLSEAREHEFVMAIDITRARSARIHPLASHAAEADGVAEHIDTAPAKLPAPIELGLLPSELIDETPNTSKGRIERWQAKLLDLSLRNKLLNFKPTKQTVPCQVPDVGTLEDLLADGKKFRLYPLMQDDPIGDRQLSPQEKNNIIRSTVEDAFNRGQITVPYDKKDTDARLLTLHRKAKSDLQEGGANTLFLAAGFLRWQREGDTKTYRAPLLLVPIKLERKSAQSAFKVLHHEDEVRINATLLEFLKRDFDLSLPELEGELPTDDSGIDVAQIFELMRSRVRDISGFEVVEDIAISTFAFSKFLMWKDLVDRTDQLRTNRLVAHLVDNPEKTFDSGSGSGAPVEPHEMDTRIAPHELLTPLPADSSQLAAVVAASEGHDFVLIGPPGTGKSQTIANIICQCIAHDKTVLFVAEKAAALDVVQRRLQACGLGDAVLELHSNKTDRKTVLTQLGKGWDRASSANEGDWLNVTQKLQIKRDQLNTYVGAVHAKGTQGFSVFEAVSWLASAPTGLSLNLDNKDTHDAESFEYLLTIASDLERIYTIANSGPPLSLVGQADWSFDWEDKIVNRARALQLSIKRALDAADTLGAYLFLIPEPTGTLSRLHGLTLLSQRAAAAAKDIRQVPNLSKTDLQTEIDRFKAASEALRTAKERMQASYSETDITKLPIDQLDTEWRLGEASIWPLSLMKKAKVRKLLQTYVQSGTADPAIDLPAIQDARHQLSVLSQMAVAPLAGDARSVEQLQICVAQAVSLREAVIGLAPDVQDTANFANITAQLKAGPDGEFRRLLLDWQAAHTALQDATEAFETLGGYLLPPTTLGELDTALDQTVEHRGRLSDWTRWQTEKLQAESAGLSPLVEALETGQLTTDAQTECRRAYVRGWLPLAMDASVPLRSFAYWEHEDIIDGFRALDDQVAKLAPIEAMRRIHHHLPARDGVARKSALGVLRHQLGLQRPSMAIRNLLDNLGDTLPKLAPCVLMSPLSIAQYLPAGQATFDVVIFDEASQITTWDAVGAIARGKQSIIVGDPKQLPPTNFFGRSDDGDGDDDGVGIVNDMPSILDEVATAGIPVRRLDWHYRSRDEALIAFSNHFYYNGDLVTFPAPATESKAVQFHKIDGTYARGAGRTNADEAKAIVRLIQQRLMAWLDYPEEDRPTLGVITFNVQQQGLILDLLDQVRRNNSELEWFFSDDREEPVIVKNLENIQGDERDVILFSITFAADIAGKLTMNFGALNSDGGERRLNVAVTRARSELHVFASITHEQIDLSRTRATGVRDLKTFLDYAERGAIALPARDEGSLGPAENPFEESVAAAFRAKGWEVRTQIGVSGFRIDLGVVNPDQAGAYLAGIECDGATYHSSATARDRDKVRQAVLENLGWTILRVWSTDWFRNPAAVVERLHEQLEQRLKEYRADAEEKLAALEAKATFSAADDVESNSKFTTDTPPEAVQPEGANNPDPGRFFDVSYMGELRQIVAGILTEKAPLPLKNLGKAVAHRHGWQRTGPRIMKRVEHALGQAELHDEFGNIFVWEAGTHNDRVPFRGLCDRSIQDVSRSEIAAVLNVISADILASEDPIGDLARHLGLSRVSRSARDYLEAVTRWYETEAS